MLSYGVVLPLLTAALAPTSYAQTFTSCNPLKSTTCPIDPALSDGSFVTDFTTAKSLPSGWQVVQSGQGVSFDGKGMKLTVAKQGDNPTVETAFYVLFGSFEVTLTAAPGVGIVSSIVMQSDDLDEVDWELLGGNAAQVQANYFGKGDTTTYDRSTWHAVGTPQATPHTYRVDWTPETINWYIDGGLVRSLAYGAAQGGARYPQTPMRLRLGIWAGGDPTNGDGTVQWAGGRTDFGAAPFSMSVTNAKIVNYSPAKNYKYGDTSGSYKSIVVEGGTLMSNKDGKAPGAADKPKETMLSTSLSVASSVPTPVLFPERNGTAKTPATTTGVGNPPAASATAKPAEGIGSSWARTGSVSGVVGAVVLGLVGAMAMV